MKHTYDGYCRPESAPETMYAYKGTIEEGTTAVVSWSADVSLNGEHRWSVNGKVPSNTEIGVIRRAVEDATKAQINKMHDRG